MVFENQFRSKCWKVLEPDDAHGFSMVNAVFLKHCTIVTLSTYTYPLEDQTASWKCNVIIVLHYDYSHNRCTRSYTCHNCCTQFYFSIVNVQSSDSFGLFDAGLKDLLFSCFYNYFSRQNSITLLLKSVNLSTHKTIVIKFCPAYVISRPSCHKSLTYVVFFSRHSFFH